MNHSFLPSQCSEFKCNRELIQYDPRGRSSLQISFEGVHALSVYDDRTGRLLEMQYFTDSTAYANGSGSPQERSKNTFDNYGRVIKVEHFVGVVLDRTETTTYDNDGRVETSTNPEGTIRYTYDVHGRMTRKEWASRSYSMLAGHAYENRTDYEYDNLGRLKKVTQVD